MEPSSHPISTCGEALRYSISTVLVVLLLGLLPAACSHPEEPTVAQESPSDSRPADL